MVERVDEAWLHEHRNGVEYKALLWCQELVSEKYINIWNTVRILCGIMQSMHVVNPHSKTRSLKMLDIL